jgi:hypothetical protein
MNNVLLLALLGFALACALAASGGLIDYLMVVHGYSLRGAILQIRRKLFARRINPALVVAYTVQNADDYRIPPQRTRQEIEKLLGHTLVQHRFAS